MHTPVLLFLSNLFSSDMIIIVLVALLLFGGDKLPEIARGLGKGIRDFKDASEGVKREINNQIYSYEEKKEEDKRIEEAIKAQQAAAEVKPPVENTMPLSDSIFTATGSTEPESQATEHNELVTENHHDGGHSDTEKPAV